MLSTKPMDKNIQFLITANYRRMVSFEQAAFLTSEPGFKEFYLAKADESEINIKQLQLMLQLKNSGEPATIELTGINKEAYLPSILDGRKNAGKVLASIKLVEKSIAGWYKNALKEISDLPKEIIELVEGQYKSLNNTRLQLETL